MLQPVPDDGCSFGGVGGVVPSAVLDEEWRLPAWGGVDLDAAGLVLVAGEVTMFRAWIMPTWIRWVATMIWPRCDTRRCAVTRPAGARSARERTGVFGL